jgi:putative ubiquitin-RnfH superfamily antitoxin RatB of RatAB toxin-antitoxin module
VATTDPATPGTLAVEVVHAWPDRCWSVVLALPPGARVGDALVQVAEGLAAQGLDLATLGLAVFGKPVATTTPLHEGDRIELLRSLVADPRQARANRAVAAKRKASAPRGGAPG